MPHDPRGGVSVVIAGLILLAACGGDESEQVDASSTTDAEATAADGPTSSAGATTQPATTAGPTTDRETTAAPTTDRATTTTASPFVVDQLGLTVDGAETSQLATATNQPPVLVFDRFEIDGAEPTTSILWEGIYCRVVEEAPEPAPTSTGFLLTIYADGSDGPDQDTKVASFGYDISEVEQELLATMVQPCGEVTSTWAYYRYSAPLADPLVLEDGRAYWLSIQALTPNFGTFWGWRGSTSGDSSSLQLFDGTFTELTEDRAFALEGAG
ncbi:MAG: hypothetical protein ACR2QK_10345 [Acidimicrobiales bacterium]